MSHEKSSSSVESSHEPDFEFAGSLQAVLKDVQNRGYSLDIHQEDALTAVGEALIDGTPSGYIEMATSTGKSVIEVLIAEAAVKAGKRVLLLAPTKQIANQLYGHGDNNERGLAGFARLPEGTVLRQHYDNFRGDATADIVVSTYQSLLHDARLDHKNLGQFDVVIADECHRGLGENTSRMLQTVFPDAFKLGLSATPDYAVNRRSEEVFDTRLYEFSLINAIETGRTAPVRALLYETDESLTLTVSRKEFTDKELEPLIRNSQRNATAVSLTQAFVKEGRQGIISCVSGQANLHARLLADMLKSQGVKAFDIGAHLSKEDIAVRLKAYDAGIIDVLTFTKSLEEGWDSDRPSFAINLAPTTSPVRVKQLLGRILRRNSDDTESVFVDFVDTTKGLSKMQYTALHALDLDEFDVERVLGEYKNPQNRQAMRAKLLRYVSPDLMERLLRSQGKLVKDVSAAKVVDPLVLKWDGILAAEGLPAELSTNGALPPRLEQRVRKAYATHLRKYDEPPTLQELRDLIGNVSSINHRLLSSYAVRAVLDESEEIGLQDIPNDDELSDAFKLVAQRHLEAQLAAVFETIPEREALILKCLFGLETGNDMTHAQVAEYLTEHDYGKITAGRVSQLALQALSKMRHPYRSQTLRDYLD